MKQSVDQMIQWFITLDYASKHKKIVDMLDKLQNIWGVIEEFRSLVQMSDTVPESTLNMIYTTIIKTANQIQKDSYDIQIQKIGNIKTTINNIQSQEREEKENTEEILNQL